MASGRLASTARGELPWHDFRVRRADSASCGASRFRGQSEARRFSRRKLAVATDRFRARRHDADVVVEGLVTMRHYDAKQGSASYVEADHRSER